MEMQRKYHKGDEDHFVRYVSGLSEYRRRILMTKDQGRNVEIIFLREPFGKAIMIGEGIL